MSRDEKEILEILAGLAVLVLAAYAVVAYVAGSDTSSDPDSSDGTSQSGLAQSGLGQTILGALASFENVATMHNNPGGICGSFDSNGNCLGPKTFATIEDGVAAASSKIESWIASNPGITVAAFVKKWSGGTGQVLQNYVNQVANYLGLDPNDPIADASAGDENDVSD